MPDMKYVCSICGYVYDEEVEGVKFSDLPESWTCPICGAAKSAFVPKDAAEKAPKPAQAEPGKAVSLNIPAEENLQHLTVAQLAAVCSNLARGCEKQYKFKEQEKFTVLSKYFDSLVPSAEESEVSEVLNLIDSDLETGFPQLDASAAAAHDRGAMRAKVWSEKVAKILKSLLERYEKEGESFLEDTDIWVCTVCGFVYVGDKAPALCPVCKVPDWKFEKIAGR